MSGSSGWFSAGLVRHLVIALFCLKLAATAWATAVHSERVYDGDHHIQRARTGGLRMDKMAYNPPLYYFPALAAGTDSARFRVLKVSNFIWIGLFYALWIWFILPQVFPQRRSWAVASIILLAIPGYQKLAAMVHPDNLHAALAAVAVAAWLTFRRRLRSAESDDGPNDWWPLVGLCLAIGLAGWTRPFAAATVAALSIAVTVTLYRGYGLTGRFLGRLVLAGVLIGTVSSSWYAYRWAETGRLGAAYRRGWLKKFDPDKERFDFVHYYTSFYLSDLLKKPRRTDRPRVPDVRGTHNSFFTLMYSEVWGDHWLYFSGRSGRDGKKWPKRIVFVVALPLVPLLLWGFIRTGRALWRGRPLTKRQVRLRIPIVLFAIYAAIAIALYINWQTGGGLSPGKNSGVKFIYNAHIFPLVLAIAFFAPMSRRWFDVWIVYGLVLYAAAFPVALYWPL